MAIEPIEAEIVRVSDTAEAPLMAMERSQIDTQITTAKRFPRSIKAFHEQAMTMATLDEDTAASCFYALPRAGKTIEGPSIRMAEIVASAWGNVRYQARIIEIGREFVTAQGVCMDLEKNVASSVEVKRRIISSKGVRFNEDMIQTTCNAACSIAMREAVFRVVPRALWKTIYEQARAVSLGKAETMEAKRDKATAFFRKLNVTDAQICARLGKASVADLTTDDLVTLRGLATAIKDGDTTVESAFELDTKTVPTQQDKFKAALAKPESETSNG